MWMVNRRRGLCVGEQGRRVTLDCFDDDVGFCTVCLCDAGCLNDAVAAKADCCGIVVGLWCYQDSFIMRHMKACVYRSIIYDIVPSRGGARELC